MTDPAQSARPASPLEVRTLTDGGQPASEVAGWIAEFLSKATRSLDIALYDFALTPPTAAPIIDAIHAATARGVAIRLAYNVDHPRGVHVPPPPKTDPSLVDQCGVPSAPIPGIPDLMHHKYVVRDGGAVWTGSTNWTDDSWTREENVIAVVDSPAVAAGYARNFEELWTRRRVQGTGEYVIDPDVRDGISVRPWFCPGRGRRLSHRIASAMAQSDRRIRICSPVLTSGPIIATLAEIAGTGRVDLAGTCDATQMREVIGQWSGDEHAAWKIPTFRSVVQRAPFSGKVSTPYGPGTVHDYMHAKFVVADDTVFLGSYNLSHSGEENAENVLEVEDPGLADRLAAFADQVRGRYPPLPADVTGIVAGGVPAAGVATAEATGTPASPGGAAPT